MAAPCITSGAARIPPRTAPGAPLAVIFVVAAAASLPFAFNERDGALGEGIYTNDQAAQLFWTDWLQHGLGPEPKAVQFGYPTGPQAVAAAAAEATGASLLDAFNGLLLAIPVLTALAALAALGLPPGRRVVRPRSPVCPTSAHPSSPRAPSRRRPWPCSCWPSRWVTELGREPRRRGSPTAGGDAGGAVLFLLASVFVYSLPGLAWFALAVPSGWRSSSLPGG